jgi:uncharacterized protein YkwD
LTRLTIRRAIAAAVLVGGLIIGVGSPAQATTTPASTADGHQAAAANCTSSPDSGVWTKIAWQIFDLINQQRVQNGVAPLQADQGVSDAAIAHTIKMADTGIFSHVIDGKGPDDRLRDHGVTFTSWGENIIYDWCQSNGKPAWNVAGFAQNSVNWWMNSPGHRKNILNPDFNLTGIGIAARARDNRGYIYATQDFIHR